MENLVKGLLFSIITIILLTILLIVVIPWLWNWIVFIYQSPLGAGQASKQYIWESFVELLPFILTGIMVTMFIQIAINNQQSNNYYTDVELLPGSQVYIPTLPSQDTAKTTPQVLPSQDLSQSTSRGVETIIVVVPTNDGGIFRHVVPGSKEHTAALAEKENAIRELERDQQQASNEKLKEVKNKLVGRQI